MTSNREPRRARSLHQRRHPGTSGCSSRGLPRRGRRRTRDQPRRTVAHVRGLELTYRGGRRGSATAALVAALLLAAGLVTGRGALGGVTVGLAALGWVAWAWRLRRLPQPGPGGGGPAGVREPRPPRPRPPAGAMALPVPEDPPDDAVARSC
jgi:hypothetical protein